MSKRLVGKQPPRKRLRTKQQEGTSVAAASARAEEPAIAAAASKYDDTLRKIFYDARDGFGSIEKWKAAKTESRNYQSYRERLSG